MEVRRAIGAVALSMGLVAIGSGAAADLAAGAANPGFQGTCSGTSPLSCTLDEPMGNDPGTFGTVTVTRVGATLTFAWAGTLSGSEPIQLCATTGSSDPYGTIVANTCAGNAGFPVVDKPASFPFSYTVPGATDTDTIWFALHVNTQGATTYVAGGVTLPGVVTTTTTAAPTTTTTAAPTTTTTAAPTTTTTAAPTTTTTAAPTTTTTAAATTTTALVTTTTAGATTPTAAGATTTVTDPATTAVSVGAGAIVSTSPTASVLGEQITPSLPRTGGDAARLTALGGLLSVAGATLLAAGRRRREADDHAG
jgi:LPXTG-motif cell wall-anchored protein